MKRLTLLVLGLSLVLTCSVGCGEKTATKSETTVTTPGGSKTTTVEKETKTTGDNPPK